MRAPKTAIALTCLVAAMLLPTASASAAEVEAKPAWLLSATALPTNFVPGSHSSYLLIASNVGAKASSGPVSVTDTLPSGLTFVGGSGCEVLGQTVKCTEPNPVPPGGKVEISVVVEVEAGAPASVLNKVKIEGGGALPVSIERNTTISSTPAPFGFLPGFQAPVVQADGAAATQAGSHPYQWNTDFGFPTEKPLGTLGSSGGHLRDVTLDFPPGEIVDPAATPVLCTEVLLTSEGNPGCPAASQVGIVEIVTVLAVVTTPLYNMVPPPGTAAQLGFDALGVGIFVHVSGGVRSDGDFGITGTTPDALALTNNPIFGARVQLWGDPSAAAHDQIRHGGSVEEKATAFFTLPGNCSGKPLTTSAHADSWEAPGVFASASYESAALDGTPVSLSGCEELGFEPSIEAKPTTGLIDSPSGLDFDLKQPQNTDKKGRYPAALKDISVTLPEGLVVNPSSAVGQQACSAAQIGLLTAVGQAPAHFSKQPPSCPDASKLGTMEASTPLLAQFDPASGAIAHDPQGNPIPRPVHGSVYLAEPFQNPFSSLIAIYLSVEDPQSGTYAKLAGLVHADPASGRLSTQLSESPQLPLEDVRLHLFGGARGSLRTPPACATYATGAQMSPWSGGLDASSSDSFTTTAAPGGGACPASAPTAPNQPSFITGTLAPQAGTYSPLVGRLSREDGSQNIAGFEATLAPGLLARLAGIPYCTEAEIAAAKARSKPNDGALEQASPSCPAASRLGSADAAAGAGPTPLHTNGNVYLAGPYKGAPLSAVVITPAIAGPFDLGTVVVRAALYLDPVSARARAVSDPLPTILDGIPLDLRWVVLKLDRPHFTLNPTSCDPTASQATATSVFGQSAALTSRFQVGGCNSLPYKPKLHTRLFGPIHRGGHPRLRAVFEAKPGEANTARIVFALPRSEFIDQAHFRTICTRVQFAANQCPAGSVYGHIKAFSPLVDYPLEGPVYLRSSSHELPDLVMALRGPASQPIAIDLAGQVDSVNGGIRATFNGVPDAPVSKAIVTMQGGRKGLFQNSTNICKGVHRANLTLSGQNGKLSSSSPQLKASCPKKAAKKKRGGHRR